METMNIYDVFTIADTNRDDGKQRWLKVGVGFCNRDDSINLVLDANPVNGRLHIRTRRPKQEQSN